MRAVQTTIHFTSSAKAPNRHYCIECRSVGRRLSGTGLTWAILILVPLFLALFPPAINAAALPTSPKVAPEAAYMRDVTSIAFSPDGRTLASGGSDSTIKLWDVPTLHLKKTFTSDVGGVYLETFSPDGKTLTSRGNDGDIKLWDTTTARLKRTFTGEFEGAFSRDGKTFASAGLSATIKLWDTTTGHLKRTIPEWVSHFAFSGDGKTLVAVGKKTVMLRDAATGKLKRTIRINTYYDSNLSPNGKSLAIYPIPFSNKDNIITVWDITTGHIRSTVHIGNELGSIPGVSCVAFSCDGMMLAAGSGANSTIRLWDTATGKLKLSFGNIYSKTPTAVAFSPDRKTLASGDNDGGIKLWDIGTGHLKKLVPGVPHHHDDKP